MQTPSKLQLDIIIPVYNEGDNIAKVLLLLKNEVKASFRVLICYDFDDDNTLPVAQTFTKDLSIQFVRNSAQGPHAAIRTGFSASTAPFVLVYPADDFCNANIIDVMLGKAINGADIVCPSRFMPGGTMQGAPLLKALFLRSANFVLYHLVRIGTHDASNGFRLFSRKVLTTISIESTAGFTYSIELLVKAHRARLQITEIPAIWIERNCGSSRFKLFTWLPSYLRWFFYALCTKLPYYGKS